LFVACSEPKPINIEGEAMPESSSSVPIDVANPFFTESPLELGYPPFDAIAFEHYAPAFARGMAEETAEVDAIATQSAPPSFANTIAALEVSGQLLNRVSRVFYSMTSVKSDPAVRALEQELAVTMAEHTDNILLNQALFARISQLYEQRSTAGLDAESVRLIESYYRDYVRAGAALTEAQQARMREINAQLSVLQIQYNQNILNESNELAIVVESQEALTGLDAGSINAAAKAARDNNTEGNFLLPLVNTSDQPLLAQLQNRSLRERIHRASLSRGNRGNAFDNRQTLVSILRLRAERAQLLGYDNHADYVLDVQTAGTVEAVNDRLTALIEPAVANVRREGEALQALIEHDDEDFRLAAWDWSYYSEKLRAEQFEFDDSQLRDYLELENVLTRGVFFAAEQLYGISFRERFDLPVYEDGVRVFEVFDPVGTTQALFIADLYARPSKRGGGWTNSYVSQSDLLGSRAVVAINLNITQPAENDPTLLTLDEVTTLFHEFGHALHNIFSDVTFPYFSGSRVPRDFVEFPSQVNEMWVTWPEVLRNYAVHFETGEPLPTALLNRINDVQQFNQGFATTEYLAASLLDQRLHQLAPNAVPDAAHILDFEVQVLSDAGIPLDTVPPRYRSTYFRHIMGGYSAGYYSYIWSEVLDADTIEWFKENGGLQRANGERFRQALLSRGGSVDAMTLYRNFRGRDPAIEPLLRRRGLL
jgi:peptidyl-dipeptidase Dcp